MIYLIVAFLALTLGEIAYSHYKKLGVYKFRETASHLSTGILQQLMGAAAFATLLPLFAVLNNHIGVIPMNPSQPAHWLAIMLSIDFLYYIAHRCSHRVNIFIAAHCVHHQADDFNHASALRQNWNNRAALFIFFLPLALYKAPLSMILTCQLANMFIQFFAHNGIIRRHLGIVEFIFVTPRSHRVHHGTNEPYLDRNFGGLFIIWDRLFGTYQDLDEKIEVKIGVPERGMNHYDLINANLNYYQRIFFVFKRRSGLLNRVKILFQSPETLSAELSRLGHIEKSERPESRSATHAEKWAVLSLLVGAIGALAYFLKEKDHLSPKVRFILGALVLGQTLLIGRVLQPSRGRKKPESRRLNNFKFESGGEREFFATLNGRVKDYLAFSGKTRFADLSMWIRTAAFLGGYWAIWATITFGKVSAGTALGLVILLGFIGTCNALSISHDASHSTFSRYEIVNKALFWISMNQLGLYAYLWKIGHTTHHLLTNVPGNDVGIEGNGFIRLASHTKWRPIFRFQHIYGPMLYPIYTLTWSLMRDWRMMREREISGVRFEAPKWRWAELIGIKAAYFFYTIAAPILWSPFSWKEVLVGFLVMHFVLSVYVAFTLFPSHLTDEVEFVEPKDGKIGHSFVMHQLITTSDYYSTSRVANVLMGGFNAHVVHHLFPNMNSTHYPEMAKILQKTCAEYELPYQETTLPKAIVAHIRFLKKMGQNPDQVDRRSFKRPGLKNSTRGRKKSHLRLVS